YYEQAKNKGFTLKEIPIAIDAIAIVVHPSLSIKGLTLKQVDDIYNGKIRNWQEVGGPNLTINPYSKVKDSPPFQKFASTTTEALRLLANDRGGIYKTSAPLAVSQCNVKTVPLADEKSGKLDFIPPYQEPFIPLSECPNKRNKLNIEAFKNNTYPHTRRLFVVVKKDGQLAEQAGEYYAKMLLTDQGQELIEKAGFVRLR
ncbi:MAG TPA: substrate-binding domain-containing protein, partial [Allocoleopsis sp.]